MTDERATADIVRAVDDAWARKDVNGFVALFAPDATVESPLIRRLFGKETLRGHDEIRLLAQTLLERGVVWGSHAEPAVRGSTIFVEYGGNTNSVDVIDVQSGVIKSLRAYLGWRSLAKLSGAG